MSVVRTSEYSMNLITCPRWNEAVLQGRAEYEIRSNRRITTAEFLEQSLKFTTRYTGPQLYDQIHDAFDYDVSRKSTVIVSPLSLDMVKALSKYLTDTCENYHVNVQWTRRYICLSSLFLFSNYLVTFRGRSFPISIA